MCGAVMWAAGLNLPAGTHLEFAGEAQEQARSQRDLLAYSVVTALGIALLVSIIARNGRNLAIVLANLPFAFVGGVAAVALSGALTVPDNCPSRKFDQG